jgi:hypothetical protein
MYGANNAELRGLGEKIPGGRYCKSARGAAGWHVSARLNGATEDSLPLNLGATNGAFFSTKA